MGAAGRSSAVVALTSVLALGLPGAAGAEVTELALDGGTLAIKASDERDVLEVTAGRNSVVVSDRYGIPESETPCRGDGAGTTVSCPRALVDVVVIDLGDADDSFDGDGDLRFEVEGDSGDDEMDGGDAADLLEGKLGDDTLDGSEGSDELIGGLDDDTLFGKGGKDMLDGGPGADRGDGGAGKDRCHGVEKYPKRGCG